MLVQGLEVSLNWVTLPACFFTEGVTFCLHSLGDIWPEDVLQVTHLDDGKKQVLV